MDKKQHTHNPSSRQAFWVLGGEKNCGVVWLCCFFFLCVCLVSAESHTGTHVEEPAVMCVTSLGSDSNDSLLFKVLAVIWKAERMM